MIAKTILDSTKGTQADYIYDETGKKEENSHSTKNLNFGSWKFKLIVGVIIIVAILLVVTIGGVIGFFLIRYALPILIVVLFISILMRKR